MELDANRQQCNFTNNLQIRFSGQPCMNYITTSLIKVKSRFEETSDQFCQTDLFPGAMDRVPIFLSTMRKSQTQIL